MEIGKRTKCRCIIVTIVLGLLIVTPTFAAEGARTLSYQDALNLAKANSPDYKIANITKQDSILNSSVAKDWIPSINLQSALYSGGVTFFGGTKDINDNGKWHTNANNSLNLTLGLNFTLSASKFFDFSKQSATKESADAVYNKTIQGYDSNVFATYWGLKSYELAVDAAQTSYDSAKSTYDNVMKKYNNGMASSLDKANAELSLSKAEASLINAKTNAQKQKIALKTVIGYDGQMPFVLDDVPKAVQLELPDAEKLYNEYLNRSYDIRMYRASENSIKANLDSVKWSAYTPTLSLGANYSILSSKDYFVPSNYYDNLGISVGAQMSLDGFIPGTTTYTTIKSLSNNAKIATLQRQKAEQNLLSSIEDALGSLKANYESITAAEITLKTAEESYKLTKDSFDNGKSTMESFMNAESTLLNARTNLISANMTYLLSEQTLATTLGITVEELEQKYKVKDNDIPSSFFTPTSTKKTSDSKTEEATEALVIENEKQADDKLVVKEEEKIEDVVATEPVVPEVATMVSTSAESAETPVIESEKQVDDRLVVKEEEKTDDVVATEPVVPEVVTMVSPSAEPTETPVIESEKKIDDKVTVKEEEKTDDVVVTEPVVPEVATVVSSSTEPTEEEITMPSEPTAEVTTESTPNAEVTETVTDTTETIGE